MDKDCDCDVALTSERIITAVETIIFDNTQECVSNLYTTTKYFFSIHLLLRLYIYIYVYIV